MPSPFGNPALASSSRAEFGLISLLALLADGRVVHEAQRRVDRAERGYAEAEIADLDEAVAVERPGERRPHLEAGLFEQLLERLVEILDAHRLDPGVHVDRVEARPRRHVDHDVGVRLEALDQLRRHRRTADDLDVAGLERRRQRLGLDDRPDVDALELGARGIVVVLERLQPDALAEHVLGDPERAGADRGEAVLRGAQLLERAAIDDRHRPAARALGRLDQERGLRPGELEAHGHVVDLQDVHDVRQHLGLDRLRRVLGALEGEHDVFGRERIAVVEGDPFAEVEGVLGTVVRDLPVLGEIGLSHEIAVDVGQAREHVRRDLEFLDLIDPGRVERADLANAGPAGLERAAALLGHRPAGC